MKANSNLKPFLKRILLMLAIVLTLTGVPSLQNGNNFPFSAVTVEAATKLTTPTISSISNTSKGVKLNWKKSSKATGYYIYRKTSSGSWTKIKTIKKNTTVSYTDTSAKNGTTYSYKVKAYSGKTTASSSTKKITRVAVPTISSLASKTCVSLTAKVTSTKKMSGYQIQYSTSKSFSSATKVSLSSGTSASKTVKSLKYGKTYYVRARAYKTVSGKKYYSAWSSAKSIKINGTHDYSLTKTVAATCTTDGYKLYTCNTCGGTFKETISATGHTSGSWQTTKAATCTTAGTKVKKCTTCGTVLETATIAATGHTSSDWVVTKKATCTTAGTKQRTCTVCGAVTQTATIAATGHTSSDWIITKAATCTTAGTKVKKCTICGEILETATIAATGHSYTSKVTEEPTCAKTGIRTYTCSTCGDTYTVTIDVTDDHDYQLTSFQAATCHEDGYKTYTCSVCGSSYTETIAATGAHDYQVTDSTEATYYTDGSTTYTCSLCGDTYTETVDATGKAAAQADYEEAEAALTSAQTAYDEAETALATAQAELTSAQDAEDTAEADLATKQAAVTAATTALTEAQEALEEAQAAYDASDVGMQVNAAEEALTKAEAELEKAEEKQALGSYAFFDWLGCEAAMEILETASDGVNEEYSAHYPEYTIIGDSSDATSLTNLMNTVQYLVECNELRNENDVADLNVVPELMAMAECNANASDVLLDHSYQFNVGENWAANNGTTKYHDPFTQWYYDELEIIESGGTGNTGHYYTIISEDNELTGFAICTRGTTWSFTFSQTFTSSMDLDISAEVYPDCVWSDGSGEPTYTSYTVSEFSELLDQYYDEVVTQPEAAVEEAEAALTAAQTAAENDETATALTAAQEAVTKTQAALDEAQAELETAEAALTSAQNAVSEAETAVTTATTALTEAETALAKAKEEFEAAEEEMAKFN